MASLRRRLLVVLLLSAASLSVGAAVVRVLSCGGELQPAEGPSPGLDGEGSSSSQAYGPSPGPDEELCLVPASVSRGARVAIAFVLGFIAGSTSLCVYLCLTYDSGDDGIKKAAGYVAIRGEDDDEEAAPVSAPARTEAAGQAPHKRRCSSL